MSRDLDAPIYVAGHRGLAGSAMLRCLQGLGAGPLLTRQHDELDLLVQADVREFFQAERPATVILCAARVGGIGANSSQPAEFIHQNLAIQTHVIHEAWSAGVENLVFLGSSCIYPRDCPQPMQEGHLLTGPLELTNRPYAVAKIAGVEMCWSYNRQYSARYLVLMPTNLYGAGDNYDLESSHVLAAFIRRMHDAKVTGAAEVVLWGTGAPFREFLCSDDLADATLFLLQQDPAKLDFLFQDAEPPMLNVGYGEEITIRDLATIVKEVVGYEGALQWDPTKPDGTPRKLMDSSRLQELGWRPKVSLRDGIEAAYRSFQQQS